MPPASFTAELALEIRTDLGEGPVWDERAQALLFVDITGERVHRFEPASGAHTAFYTGAPPGAVVLREDGGLVLACLDRFCFAEADGSGQRDLPGFRSDGGAVRFNDAKVDPAGRFLAGTMDWRQAAPLGALYQLDPTGEVTTLLEHVTISNGLAWTPDGGTLYYIDTPRHTVDAFDVDLETGALANRRVVAEVPDASPDGMAIDDEGCLWVACWGGSRVDRFSPRDGRLLAQVAVPTAHVSSVAFGGPGLDQLYITTARHLLGAAEAAGDPHAGDLFVAAPGVSGPAPDRFAGSPV